MAPTVLEKQTPWVNRWGEDRKIARYRYHVHQKSWNEEGNAILASKKKLYVLPFTATESVIGEEANRNFLYLESPKESYLWSWWMRNDFISIFQYHQWQLMQYCQPAGRWKVLPIGPSNGISARSVFRNRHRKQYQYHQYQHITATMSQHRQRPKSCVGEQHTLFSRQKWNIMPHNASFPRPLVSPAHVVRYQKYARFMDE